MNINQDLEVHYRTTYGLLDWLGDIGGFSSFVLTIAVLINQPNSDFALKSKLLTELARVKS